MLVPSCLKKFTAFTNTKAFAFSSAINFRREGTDCSAVAADGYKMIQVDWQSERPLATAVGKDCDPPFVAMVSIGSFNNAVKLADTVIKDEQNLSFRKANACLPYRLCEETQQLGAVGNTVWEMGLETVDAKLPPCNDIWPDTHGATSIKVNAQYLKDLCDAVLALHGADKSSPTVTLTVRNKQSALLGTAVKNLGGTAKISLKCVIMPLAD